MVVLEYVIPFFATIASFILVGFIVWLINRSTRERRLRMIALQEKILEKFASSQELAHFLQTPEGQRYFRSLAQQPAPDPKERVIKSVRTGVILVILAVGLIAISFLVGFSRPMEEPPFVIGFLALFLGIGFIGSAAVSYFLSKMWGLLPEDRRPSPSSQS